MYFKFEQKHHHNTIFTIKGLGDIRKKDIGASSILAINKKDKFSCCISIFQI